MLTQIFIISLLVYGDSIKDWLVINVAVIGLNALLSGYLPAFEDTEVLDVQVTQRDDIELELDEDTLNEALERAKHADDNAGDINRSGL
jgi:hypothetical protein